MKLGAWDAQDFTVQVKIFQLSRVNTSFAPSGSLESRTATTPGRFRATSTHWTPLLPLRVRDPFNPWMIRIRCAAFGMGCAD